MWLHAATPTCPLLRVREVRDRIPVGGDEHAPGVLADAERCVLDLVVVDVAVKPNNHCTNLQATQ